MDRHAGSPVYGVDQEIGYSHEPDRVFFLNFNYTNLLNRAIRNHKLNFDTGGAPKTDEINIHGSINDDLSDILLGYGNISESIFEKVESLKDSDLFENFKTFYYTYSSAYGKLREFMDINFFSVYIIGHSCGSSDRELLSEIFQHSRCAYVRQIPFPKGPYDFKDRSIKVAGCLDKVADLRKIMLPQDDFWIGLLNN